MCTHKLKTEKNIEFVSTREKTIKKVNLFLSLKLMGIHVFLFSTDFRRQLSLPIFSADNIHMKMKPSLLVIATIVLILTAALAAKKIFLTKPQPIYSDLFLQEKKRRQDIADKEDEREQRSLLLKRRRFTKD